MLYLKRKIGESIIINNDIKVTIVSISNNIVNLGFTSPTSTTILRQEIHDRIAKENIKASSIRKNLRPNDFSNNNPSQ